MAIRLAKDDAKLARLLVSAIEKKHGAQASVCARALLGNPSAKRQALSGEEIEHNPKLKIEPGDLALARLAERAVAKGEGHVAFVCVKAILGHEASKRKAAEHLAAASLAPRAKKAAKKAAKKSAAKTAKKSGKKAKKSKAAKAAARAEKKAALLNEKAKELEAKEKRLEAKAAKLAEKATQAATPAAKKTAKKAAKRAKKVEKKVEKEEKTVAKKAKTAKKSAKKSAKAAKKSAKKTAKKSGGTVSKAEFLARMAAGRAKAAKEGGTKPAKKTAKRGKKAKAKKTSGAKKSSKKSKAAEQLARKSKAEAVAEKAGEMLAATAHAVSSLVTKFKNKPSAALKAELAAARETNKQLKELAAARKLNERLKKEAAKKGGATSPNVKKIEAELARVQAAEEREIAKAEKVLLEDPIPVPGKRVLTTPPPGAARGKPVLSAAQRFITQKKAEKAARLAALAAAQEEEAPVTQRTPSVRTPATQHMTSVPQGTAAKKQPSGYAKRKAKQAEAAKVAGPQKLPEQTPEEGRNPWDL